MQALYFSVFHISGFAQTIAREYTNTKTLGYWNALYLTLTVKFMKVCQLFLIFDQKNQSELMISKNTKKKKNDK